MKMSGRIEKNVKYAIQILKKEAKIYNMLTIDDITKIQIIEIQQHD